MSMAVRERRVEIAVLKTLGFTGRQVMGLVVAEAVVLGALGGALGVGSAKVVLWFTQLPGAAGLLLLSNLELRIAEALLGFGAALVLGFLAGLMPAWSAYRARISETLRTV